MLGELFTPQEMPEAPKESFFKGLFGGGTRNLDREELCKYELNSKQKPQIKRYRSLKLNKCNSFVFQLASQVEKRTNQSQSTFLVQMQTCRI